ncbi:tellurite resistance TehB family protein [Collimonas arenae]|uniref:Tellurite resistance TehB family protein n=1 Tax=Collimonas arenae TaxID=279058 RepID=A0A127PS06_9BURK|nr:methyltransferase domain-containing protein [Collimonas arenae]AMP00598.1 tellurite resistance TehB family protein [Collimonas arenae]AMP10480.1 tellurite resistance TehB family protein [Collimonas arenae]
MLPSQINSDTLTSAASPWVRRFGGLLPAGSKVLDLACGDGRHALWLAHHGLDVLAVDRNPAPLAALAAAGLATRQIDLETGLSAALDELFLAGQFAGVVVTNYLHRPLFPLILRSIAEQGVLLYETFAIGNEQFGKPSNPDFLLAQGELPALLAADKASSWHVLAFEDGYVEQPKPAMVQRICAIKGGGGSVSTLRIG